MAGIVSCCEDALLYFSAVCATRRRNVERGGRPFLLGRRSGLIEAGGSLIRGAPVRVGSSPGQCRDVLVLPDGAGPASKVRVRNASESVAEAS
jgi:hypothetical protein